MLYFKRVSKKFGGMSALNEVSFVVNEGSVHALIGPNGAGKTTLFNLTTGMLAPTSGRVLFGDVLVSELQAHKICRLGIARTFQNIRLFKGMTALETVAIGCHWRASYGLMSAMFALPKKWAEEKKIFSTAEELLNVVGLQDKSRNLAGELSYGEQRRLEIARALATKPQILLLDEPTAGMTAGETEQITDLIIRLKKTGITVFFIEHDMRFVMGVAEVVTVLNFGNLIANGTPEEIQNDPLVIHAYLGNGERFQNA